MQNEVIKKMEQLLARDRGKNLENPNSGISSPNPNPDRNKGLEGTSASGSGSGGPGLVFGSFDDWNQGKGRFEYKHRKVDMPTFDGKDPDGWILQAERYFAIYQLLNEEKIEAAVLSLKGDALAWYRWSNKQRVLETWEDIKDLFLKKFRSIMGGDLYEQWTSIEQTGTVSDYIRRFIELAASLEGVSEKVAMANFLKGLKAPIKN